MSHLYKLWKENLDIKKVFNKKKIINIFACLLL